MTDNVAVFGLGKLGATLAAVLASKKFNVVGYDINPTVVADINLGRSPVRETGLDFLMRTASAHLVATSTVKEAVDQTELAFVIVPTPSLFEGGFDNGFVLDAVISIGLALRESSSEWYTVVISSTVMPGSTAGVIQEALEAASGRVVGENLGLCYSPEFIALGSVIHDMTHPDMVLLGANDDRSRSELRYILEGVVENEPEWQDLSIIDAEIAKISVNTYVTMKISYANMIAELCETLPGADARNVAKALGADRRIGPRYLQPGGAFGGPCFPRDNKAFAALCRAGGVDASLPTATDVINRRQAERIVERIKHHDRVSIIGLSYKPNTAVTEESFGLEILQLLQHDGVVVTAHDPGMRNVDVPQVAFWAPCSQDAVNASDVVVIATPWPQFADLDYRGKTVIDVWGLLPDAPNVQRIGKAS